MSKRDEIETVAMLAMAFQQTSTYREAFALASDVVKAARWLAKHAENACNRELSEREVKKAKILETAICAVILKRGWTAEFGGDPRGFVVKLYGTGLPSNDFSGDGAFGVA